MKCQPLSCGEATVYDLRSLSPGQRAECQASRRGFFLSLLRGDLEENLFFFFFFASFAAYSLVGLEDQQTL